MRIYIIGLMVGAIGLVAASQVRADEHCGLKSGTVLKVQRWNVEKTDSGKYHVAVYLDSMDPKVIKNISGSIEFFAGKDHILTLPLRAISCRALTGRSCRCRCLPMLPMSRLSPVSLRSTTPMDPALSSTEV